VEDRLFGLYNFLVEVFSEQHAKGREIDFIINASTIDCILHETVEHIPFDSLPLGNFMNEIAARPKITVIELVGLGPALRNVVSPLLYHCMEVGQRKHQFSCAAAVNRLSRQDSGYVLFQPRRRLVADFETVLE
jgi:hypothetical protein